MKILKLDNIKVSHERDAGFDMKDTAHVITSKDTLFKTYSETAVYHILDEGQSFEELLKFLMAQDFIDKVQKGGN